MQVALGGLLNVYRLNRSDSRSVFDTRKQLTLVCPHMYTHSFVVLLEPLLLRWICIYYGLHRVSFRLMPS